MRAASPRSNLLGQSVYTHAEGTSVIVSLEDGRLVRVQFEDAAERAFEDDQRFERLPVNAGTWHEVVLGRTGVRVAFKVEGERMRVRIDGGEVVDAECAWG